ncbi:MAG: hypothetical protein NC543_03180 [bacterium]|nr:hypothetical protein [bacterium]MCM1373941.1 hypothetical protein [Muribaculum sp.]
MKLEYIINNPENALDYMERYVNDGSPSGFSQKYTTSEQTSPFGNREWFFLYSINFPTQLSICIGDLPLFLRKKYPQDSILIHPDNIRMLDKSQITQTTVRVTPTSSARTVRLLEEKYYLKLNYFGILGRVNRNLSLNHALASFEISNILYNELGKKNFEKLSFLPESSAKVVLQNEQKINMGIVVRDCTPFGGNSTIIKYKIPIFSLFSKDRKNKDDTELLIQLINHHSSNPKDYILNEIVYPIIKYYFQLIGSLGLQPEWHAQNLLLGLDDKMNICSFIMRDMESIDIDQDIREKIGLVPRLNCYPYKHINRNQYNYTIKHSFMFDFKLCKYLIEPIIKCISVYYKLDICNLIEEIRNFVDKEIKGLPPAFFPRCWYSFQPTIIDQEIDVRPYVNNGKPIYRSI